MPALSRKKIERLERVADKEGVIAAVAMDQRGSLQKAIAKELSVEPAQVTAERMAEFKAAVSKVLTPYASSILLDIAYGVSPVKARKPGTGLLLAYEKTGYDTTRPGRLADLGENLSVRRLIQNEADAIKVLLYYSPDEKPEINELKHAWVERIGAECAAEEIPFFLECLAYDQAGASEKSLEFARRKPGMVIGYMSEFSKPQYRVDVCKVEFPFSIAFVKGSKANKAGEVAYDRAEAKDLIAKAAAATHLPFIYLSAGVDDDVFREMLEMAHEAGVAFAGVLCGRATWKEGLPVYARQGVKALEDWLADRGVKNIQALNAVLKRTAEPWYDKFGGRDRIQVVDRTA